MEPEPDADVPALLADAMRDHIARALRHTGGRVEGVGGAAVVLSLHPSTLRARMRRLGLDWRAEAGAWRAEAGAQRAGSGTR